MRKKLILIPMLLLTAAAGSTLRAQTGPIKVGYERFKWQVYQSPHFDIHYYPEEEAFLEQMVSFAESAYLRVSEALDHQIAQRIPLVYYKTHPEFEQTNIVLEVLPEAVGAFAEPFQNRMVLPIDEPPDKVYSVLVHEMVHIFQYDILYGGSIGRAVRGDPPLWFMEGMASYIAQDEDSFDQMVIRDAVINSIVPGIESLNQLSFLTYRFGNAVFAFMESRWGAAGVRNFVQEYRKVLLTDNIGKAINEAFGLEVEDFNRELQKYLRKRYLPALLEKEDPAAYGREIGFRRRQVFTFSPVVSPGGELLAALSTRKGEVDLWVLSGSDGEPLRNLTPGFTNAYDYLVTEVFDGRADLAWSPGGDRLAVFARRENIRLLLIFDARTGKKLRTIKMPEIALQASPAFSPDSRRIVFAGNKAGITDIFSYDLETGEIVNHTDDAFVDANPSWSADGKEILYNRRIGTYAKIFTVSSADPSRKVQLTFGESMDIMPSYSRDGKRIYYTSDAQDKIFNLHALDLDTARARILTDVHTGVFSPVELEALGGKTVLAFTSYFQGRFRLYRMEVDLKEQAEAGEEAGTPAPAELEPFRPPLDLTVDETGKKPYKRKYDVESPGLEIGVSDDGTFYGNTSLSLSDLLGDHRWLFSLAAVSTYTRLDLYHYQLERRSDIFYHVYQYEDFYYYENFDPFTGVAVLERIEQRQTGARAGIRYPFSSKHVLETSLGFSDASVPFLQSVIVNDPLGGPPVAVTQVVEQDYQALDLFNFFSGSTVRYQRYGPFHGYAYNVGAYYSPEIGGDGGKLIEYRADYRKHFKLTRNSSFAYRLFGIWSNGSGTNFSRTYSIGGLNTIRGYEYRLLSGDRVFFQNLELRFPLVNELHLPFGAITDIRGLIFLDIGGAYFETGEYVDPDTGFFVFEDPQNPGQYLDAFGNPRQAWDFWNSSEGRLENGVAAFGLGFNFRVGFLELNWVFSKQWDFDEVHPDWRSAFYIGNKF